MPSRRKIRIAPRDSDSDESSHRFAWQKCGTLTGEGESLSIREDAVEKAEAHAESLQNILQDLADDKKIDAKDLIVSIIDSLSAIKKDHREFEVLVGVAGATGAGKSSILNALLGLREILPSGHQEAATSVPCRVSWNYDDRAGYECVANVYFQSKEEVIKSLEVLVEALLSLDSPDESTFRSSKDRDETLEQLKAEISTAMEKVRAIWKLEEEQVKEIISNGWSEDNTLRAKAIFESNPAVGELLQSSMKTLHASTNDELADMVKPYLDSTEASHGVGVDFAVWPLVKEVRLFLRSDILKSGISLVDLPGQGEIEESRAEVARKYQDRLDVTMIVAPVHRAADERIAQELLSKFQSLQMQMDGRFNKKRFSVILSKTDQIEVNDYTRLYSKDQEVQRLKSAIRTATQEKKNRTSPRVRRKLQGRAKALLRYFAQVREENVNIKEEQDDSKPPPGRGAKGRTWREKSIKHNTSLRGKVQVKALLRKIKAWWNYTKRQNKRADLEIQRCRHALSHWAISNRNNHVGERLEKTFQRQQPSAPKAQNHLINEPLGVTVLGTSSTAFWQLQNRDGAKTGFPHESFTGIPMAKQWIHKATLRSRENHLIWILNRYLVAFNKLRSWAEAQEIPDSGVSQVDIECGLKGSHQCCIKDLDRVFEQICKEVEKTDDLSNSDPIKIKFERESRQIVKTWSLKRPNDPGCRERMPWNTYRAIVARGGHWMSSGGIEYNWILDLATPLLKGLADNWKGIPSVFYKRLFTLVLQRVGSIWNRYSQGLADLVGRIDRSLKEQAEGIPSRLKAIKENLCSQVGILLSEFAKKVNRVHSLVIPCIKRELHPIFKEALQFRGHKSHASREDCLVANVPTKCSEMVSRLCCHILNLFRDGLEKFKDDCMAFVRGAIEDAKAQINLHTGVLGNSGLSTGDLRNNCLEILVSWQADWESPDEDLDHILKQDIAIPKEVTIGQIMDMEEASGNTSEDGSMSHTDTDDSDGDSDSDNAGDDTDHEDETWLGKSISLEDLESELDELKKLKYSA